MSVGLTLRQMASAGANPLGVWDSAAALFDARDGATTSGVVTVRAVAAAALFVTPCTPTGRATLYNFAAATGINGECAMAATIAYDRPEQPSDAASDTTCAFSDDALGDGSFPSNDAAANLVGCTLTADADHAIDGASLDGSARVVVSASGLQADATVAVYRPAERRSSHPTPTARSAWLRQFCTDRPSAYQSTSLALLADGLDITRMAGVSFVSENTNVIAIDGLVARGLRAGTTAVRLAASSIVRYEFAVANNVAAVARLDAYAVTSSTLTLPSGALAAPMSVVASAAQAFEFEGDAGHVYAWAVYANGDEHLVAADDLNVTALTSGLELSRVGGDGRHRVAVATNALPECGELLAASLTVCGAPHATVGVNVTLDLPVPTNLTLSTESSCLVPTDDLATTPGLASYGYVSVATLSAGVIFDSGATSDLWR